MQSQSTPLDPSECLLFFSISTGCCSPSMAARSASLLDGEDRPACTPVQNANAEFYESHLLECVCANYSPYFGTSLPIFISGVDADLTSSISISSNSSATGPSRGAPAGLAPEAVGAPVHLPSPVLSAVPPVLCPPLAGSSTRPCPGAPVGRAHEAVGAPTHFQSPVLAAVPPILTPALAGSSTLPSPGAPDGGTHEAVGPPTTTKVQPWQQILLPWPQHWLALPCTSQNQPWQQLPLSWPLH